MATPIFQKCSHCGRLMMCVNGLCNDCASYLGATGRVTGYTSRPDCPYCNGTGKKTNVFGPDTPCPHCNGTGKR